MPHVYVVWSIGNILELLFIALLVLAGLIFDLALLAENIKHRIQRLFGFRK